MKKTISLDKTLDILTVLSGAFGRMTSTVSLKDIEEAARKDYGIAKKYLKGATMQIVAHCSLAKSYKYSKDIGMVTLEHNGKEWKFLSAGRTTCFAGASRGGTSLTIAGNWKTEVMESICHNKGIKFVA